MKIKPSIAFCSVTALSLCAALLLSGCADAKKQLGLEKSAPDEFAVVKRAPLEMPPEFTLRPPEPGAPRPQEQSTTDQAREAILGSGAQQTKGSKATNAEEALLNNANAAAYPNIRQVVDAEAKVTTNKNTPVVKRLMNIGKKDTAPAKVVDPTAEAQRIKENAAQGKPVTEGDTPSVEE